MNNRRLMACLLLTAAYVISGKLGLMLALPPGYASPIFPPAGIAVAAAFIGGRRTLPWVFLGSLLLNIWVGYSASHQINAMGFAAASAIAAASMLQAALGGWWLRRMIGYPASLDHGRDILHFLLLAPAICLTSASLSVSGLSALGIIDPASFAANWAAWWVGDTLGVVVMLPLVMIAAGEPRALWQSRVRTIAVPILLIFTLFIVIFLRINKWEYDDSLSEFRQGSQQVVNLVQSKLEEQESLLEQTAGLFTHDVGGHFTREEFHRFTERSLIRFPAIRALEWAPRVDAAHRANFEAEQRKDFPGFEIRERNTAGQLWRAGERAQFYPVTYVEPLAGNEPALGSDLASTPDRQAALTEAVKRGTAVATPPVRLVQEHQQQAGMLLLLAVKTGSNESGVVLTVLRMDDFVGNLLPATRSMLYARLIDLDEQKTIYDSFAPETQKALYERTFNFGTRHYRLQTAPTPAYFMQHHGWQSWSVLAAGILGTGLFGALLLLGTGYTAHIKSQVEERTRKLKESESRFRNTMEHAPIGMGIASLDGRLLQVNHAFCAILGYEKEELEKLTIREITHTEDVASSFANIKRLLDKELDYYRSEKRYLRKDGQPVWVQLTASIERDVSGAPLYLIGQIEDITERRRAEEMLRFHSNILNNLAEGIYLIRASDGVIVFTNPQFERMFGYEPGELLGKHVSIVNAPGESSSEAVATTVMSELERTGMWDGDVQNIRKDGNTFWCHASVSTFDHPQYGQVWVSVHEDITGRKKAEDKLAESERRFRAVAQSANDAIITIAGDGIIAGWNTAAERLFGYTEAEIMRQPLTILMPERFRNLHREGLARVVAGGVSHVIGKTVELVGLRKDGSEFPLELSLAQWQAADDQFFTAIIRDITERKKAEQGRLSAETRFHMVFDNASDAIVIHNVQGRFLEVNQTMCERLGYSHEELLHLSPPDINAPEGAEKFAERGKALMAHGQITFETVHVAKDGREIPVEVSARLIDYAGKPATLSVVRDITERKKFEEELKRSSAKLEHQHSFLQSVIDGMPEPMMVIGKDYRIMLLNRVAQALTSRTDKQTLFCYQLSHQRETPCDGKEHLCPLDTVIREKRQVTVVHEHIDSNGNPRLIELLASPLLDKDKAVIGVIESARDITERKLAEEELKRSNAELEQFSYAVSHDMRQPLRMISSYLQLLDMSLADQLDSEKRGYFNFAIDGAKRLDQMLVALLEYSRVGRMGEPPRWIESRAVLDEALLFLQPAIVEAQARLDITGEWPRILVNRDEILRLLQNLIGNAAKFRVAGRTPEITVTGEIVKNEWHLYVADNGIGIIPDQIKRLFQVFQRLQSRAAYEGNGVGLALCRKIVEHHKGRIWAESAGEGRGSKFYVVLPVSREET